MDTSSFPASKTISDRLPFAGKRGKYQKCNTAVTSPGDETESAPTISANILEVGLNLHLYNNHIEKSKFSLKKKNKRKQKDDEIQDEEKEEKYEPVSFCQLFRYATACEIALVAIGLIAATVRGLITPVIIVLFGRLTNAFVYAHMNETHTFTQDLKNQTLNETEDSSSHELNQTNFIPDDTGTLQENLAFFGIGTATVAAIQFTCSYLYVASLNYAAEWQVSRLRCLFFRSILKQEIAWFDTRGTNDFASTVTEDLNKVQEGIGEKLTMFVFFMSISIFSLINAFIHGWELTLVILSVFPFLGISTGLIAKVQTSLTSTELKAYSKAGSIAEEVLSSIRTVVSFGGEQKEVERYEGKLVYARTAGVKRGIMTGVSTGVTWFLLYVSYGIAFGYGTKLVLDSRTSDSTSNYDGNVLLVVFFSVLSGSMSMGQASPYLEAFNVARAAAAKIFSIIERESAIDPTSTSGDKPNDVIGTIEFQNVHFCYPSRPEVKVLQGIDLQINPGETMALVGSSGCGKSTCIQLIQRFYDPHEGTVSLDGKDIRTLNIGWLRDQIGTVGQEPVLFATTIAENIRYGRETATFDEIQEAAKEANAHDFIMSLPLNYKTQVGDRGVQISGGQKQRIAIARALVKQPKVLLLDEATSALDNESAAIVQRALDKARKGRTTIIVAHRLSTIKSADLIVAMQNGKVVETGTHKQLMSKDGYYKSLVTSQITSKELKDSSSDSEDCEPPEDNEENGETFEESVKELLPKSDVPLSRTSSLGESLKRNRKPGIIRRLFRSYSKKLPKTPSNAEATMMEILKLNSPEWRFIVGGIIGATVQGCLVPIYAIYFGNILGTLSISDIETARTEATFYSLIFFVMGVVGALSAFFQAYMFSISGERLTMRLRKKAFQTMLRQEMGWFDDEKNSVGALCSRLSADASAVQGATGSRIGTVIQALTTLVFSGILGLYYNLKLGAVAIPFIPFVLLSVYIESKVIMGHSVTETMALENAGKIAVQTISNIRTVASLHREEEFATVYSKALQESHVAIKNKSHLRGVAFGFSQAIPFIAYSLVLLYGGHLVQKGEINFKNVFKVAEAMIIGTIMVGQAIAFAPNFSKGKVAASRMMALFSRRPAIDTSDEIGCKMTGELNHISLKDVAFTYPTRSSMPILKGINVEVNKGEKVALVGSSGCGKSTIINLLERFYDVKSGSVCINDENIQNLNVAYARSLFGLVSQEPVLFDRTISENIAYGNNTRTFSQIDIEEVAKQANIHDFVISLPDGYNTRVGDKGTQLSGGQKQRIAIARALIRSPQVLLLDEATSALDAESEKLVQETLKSAQRGRTSIVIAHRLSTIRDVDRIVVVDAGIVVEEGTHDQLIAAKGHYWQLYNTCI